jgi:hypothetical protein
MGKWKESICRWMQTICHCFSDASRRTKEAEFEIPSKRRFRMMLASEEGSIAFPQDESTDVGEGKARMGIGLRAFLDCMNEVKNQAEQLKNRWPRKKGLPEIARVGRKYRKE